MNNKTKIIIIVSSLVILTTAIILIKKKIDKRNQENPKDDIVEPYIERQEPIASKTYNVPFANTDQGNAFRFWVNKYYPKYAKTNKLDPKGSFNNSYIFKAFNTYGNVYLKQYNNSIPANIQALGFETKSNVGNLYNIIMNPAGSKFPYL